MRVDEDGKILICTRFQSLRNVSGFSVKSLQFCMKVVKGNRHKPDLKIRFWCVYIP